MKICVLTKNYGKGYTGAMTSTYLLINNWLKRGLNVYVLTINIVGPVNKNAKTKVFKNIMSLFYYVKIHNFKNFIGYSDDHFGFLFKLLNIPYIHTYHGNWPGALLHNGFINFLKGLILIPMYILTIRYAKFVGSVSEHAIKFISKFNNKVSIIHNGVDIDKKHINSVLFFRTNLSIIMVGNVDKRKFGLLLKVLKRIPFRILKHIHIFVYGKINNTNVYNMLKHYDVNFVGFSNNIPYSKFDLYLSTSLMENMSIAAVEALSSGLPVITFNVGGMNEIIHQHKTGLIIHKYDTKLMENLLEKIITKGIKFKYNNNYIIKDFDWKKSSNKYIKLFQK